jgi:hypothetical protein
MALSVSGLRLRSDSDSGRGGRRSLALGGPGSTVTPAGVRVTCGMPCVLLVRSTVPAQDSELASEPYQPPEGRQAAAVAAAAVRAALRLRPRRQPGAGQGSPSQSSAESAARGLCNTVGPPTRMPPPLGP